MNHIVIVAGGPPPVNVRQDLLPADPIAVIAADSGLDHALMLGLAPTMVVGDLDSISDAGRSWVADNDVPTQIADADKDETDLELAMNLAARGADEIVVVDSGRGRIDHALANLMLLGHVSYAGVTVSGLVGEAVVSVVRSERTLRAFGGTIVSLVPVGGAALGVTTSGMRWPLQGAILSPGETRGVSNELLGDSATVSVGSGVLLAIQSRE